MPSRFLFSTTILFLLSLISFSHSFAQADPKQQIEPSYEVMLQLVIGSNEAGTDSLPGNLSNVTRQLKSNFTFSNYRLVNTFLGRVANSGNIEYKSASNIFGQPSEIETPNFLDWTLSGLRNIPNSNGHSDFQIQAFRFGARIPVRTGSSKDAEGKSFPVINYESIGLGLVKLGVRENTPSLVGTLSLPKTSGTIFLILTIKPAAI